MIEPRTNLDITRDLLEALKNRVWVERRERSGCNCCPDTWETVCSSCGAEAGDWADSTTYQQQHKEGCSLAALILEAETFVRIEEELEGQREAVAS